MKILLPLALALLIAWALHTAIRRSCRGGGCCGEHEETVKRTPAADRNRAHYPYETVLRIGGMTCDNCARRVENALNALPGTAAKVRIDTKTATVRTKEAPDEAALRGAVAGAGYAVLEILRKR